MFLTHFQAVLVRLGWEHTGETAVQLMVALAGPLLTEHVDPDAKTKASEPGMESGTELPQHWAPRTTAQRLSNSGLWWKRHPLEWIVAAGAQPPSQASAVAVSGSVTHARHVRVLASQRV